MNKDENFKLPRLFTTQPLSHQTCIELESGQAHYLHTVMRKKSGDLIRLFDGENGEWLCEVTELSKRNGSVLVSELLLHQPPSQPHIHLLFAPIKKTRLDWMIEKAVELGVTDFHPILTQNTEVRKIKAERVKHQIFEAAEQCERLSIPTLHPIQKLSQVLAMDMPIFACLERFDAPPLTPQNIKSDVGFLIGPEGGFTAKEKEIVAKHTKPVSLGDTILRCETAAIKALVLLNA